MTVMHLVRHGETTWHAENRYAGRSDVGLTDRGAAQAETLGRWAAGAELEHLVSSDATRARGTAMPASRTTGLPISVDRRLREVDFGQAEGMTGREMEAQFPEARAAFLREPATRPLPGGETGIDAAKRVTVALTEMAAEQAGPVLVVGHSTVLRLALCQLLDIPLDAYRVVFPSMHNVAVTTIDLQPDRGRGVPVSLLRYNADITPPLR
ncbi:histidine phosphatase family protein [Curtobacterium sp. RRHDQ10]|uniref:histidine phosphatase family protein n=1 Tax=Curtobacterium phyllosphaerae TaxID=3413379 RepID=UPI003BF3EE9F